MWVRAYHLRLLSLTNKTTEVMAKHTISIVMMKNKRFGPAGLTGTEAACTVVNTGVRSKTLLSAATHWLCSLV